MADQQDIKVFISWSGELARDVAVAIRDWLPLLFDRVKPWASDTDIAAGQRGLAQIELELRDTSFGIVVVTDENQAAPWLNFEAGALSKVVDGKSDQRVVPLLVDLGGVTELTGPLSQFQAKILDHDGARSVVQSIADVAGIEQQVSDARFETYWPRLEEEVAKAQGRNIAKDPIKRRRSQSDVLNEVLLHIRSLRSDLEAVAVALPYPRLPERGQGSDFQEILFRARYFGFEVHQVDRSDRGIDVWVDASGDVPERDMAARRLVDDLTRLFDQPVSVLFGRPSP